jgi:hypothetical protein
MSQSHDNSCPCYSLSNEGKHAPSPAATARCRPIEHRVQAQRPYVHLTFAKVEKLSSANALLVRYRLVGTFDFPAANAPQPSQACAQEAAMYAGTHGERHPEYRADLCGAKKVVVRGRFDITQDFPSTAIE